MERDCLALVSGYQQSVIITERREWGPGLIGGCMREITVKERRKKVKK